MRTVLPASRPAITVLGDGGAGGSISVELTGEAQRTTDGVLHQAVVDLRGDLDERLSALERGDRGALG